MTTPRQARVSKGVRTYPWPPFPPYEFESISVTAAISGGLPKPFLVPWAAKVTAEEAVKKHVVIGSLIESGDTKAAIDLLTGTRFRDMGAKADRGTIVHAALEGYLAGKPIDTEEIQAQLEEANVPQKMWGSTLLMVNGLLEFLQDEEPEILWSEATVFNRTHAYAGTTDLIAKMRVGSERLPVVIDVKTSKRIYSETALQLCAYARAEFVGLDDGTEMPLAGSDQIPFGVVVRPTPSGKYEKAVFTLTDEVFDLFLACLHVAKNADVPEGARRP